MIYVTLLPKKQTKGSTCFRCEIAVITRVLSDAGGVVEKMEVSGSSFKTIEGQAVATVEKISFTVADLLASEVRVLLHDIEEQISLQGEGVRIFVSATAPIAV